MLRISSWSWVRIIDNMPEIVSEKVGVVERVSFLVWFLSLFKCHKSHSCLNCFLDQIRPAKRESGSRKYALIRLLKYIYICRFIVFNRDQNATPCNDGIQFNIIVHRKLLVMRKRVSWLYETR